MRSSRDGSSPPMAATACPFVVPTALEMLTSKSYVVAIVGSFLDQAMCVSRDDEVLVGPNNAHQDTANVIRNDPRVGRVAFPIQLHAQVVQAGLLVDQVTQVGNIQS